MDARTILDRAVPLGAAAGVFLAACGSSNTDVVGSSSSNEGNGSPNATNAINDSSNAIKEEGPDCSGVCGSPTDGLKNNGESDIDCGGANAPKCADAKTCRADGDCANGYCEVASKTCVMPRPDDGVKNGDESDVDCGGTVAPRCALGESCKTHEDCESDGCAYTGKCIAYRSCAAHHGGDTCGPASAQGDCCERIAVPRPENQGGAFTLDKYAVTAGRMRTFVERTRGDIRGWIQSHRPKWFLESWDASLPNTLDDPQNGVNGVNGVYQQLGPWALVGTGTEPGNRGCNVEGPGARTYWLPDDINRRFGDRQRYEKDVLDEKALNCVPQFLLAAFCAWDGGRVPSFAEQNYAYTAGEDRLYPWGNVPVPLAFGETAFDSADAAGTPPDASRFANYQYNWWSPSQRIDNDYSVYIAPPGRFPDGNGKFGHADLAGLLIEWSSDWVPANGMMTYFYNGSWEFSHPPRANYPNTIDPLTKYYAFGGRCAR